MRIVVSVLCFVLMLGYPAAASTTPPFPVPSTTPSCPPSPLAVTVPRGPISGPLTSFTGQFLLDAHPAMVQYLSLTQSGGVVQGFLETVEPNGQGGLVVVATLPVNGTADGANATLVVGNPANGVFTMTGQLDGTTLAVSLPDPAGSSAAGIATATFVPSTAATFNAIIAQWRATLQTAANQAANQQWLVSLLPQVAQLPAGFVEQDDLTRTLTQEAAQFADPSAAQRLVTWGWAVNAYRSFTGNVDGTALLDVSINLFCSDTTAVAAYSYFLTQDEAGSPSWSLQPSGLPSSFPGPGGPIASLSAVLRGPGSNGGTGADLFVQFGVIVIRVGGESPTSDPTSDMVAVANTIVQKLEAGPD